MYVGRPRTYPFDIKSKPRPHQLGDAGGEAKTYTVDRVYGGHTCAIEQPFEHAVRHKPLQHAPKKETKITCFSASHTRHLTHSSRLSIQFCCTPQTLPTGPSKMNPPVSKPHVLREHVPRPLGRLEVQLFRSRRPSPAPPLPLLGVLEHRRARSSSSPASSFCCCSTVNKTCWCGLESVE